jgi:hypothetical protein
MEKVVPIVVQLKKKLEEHHSPLLKNLMQFLIDLLKDYKNELNGRNGKQ